MPIFQKDSDSMNALAGKSVDNLAKLRQLIMGHEQTMAQNQQKADFAAADDTRKFDLEGQGQQRNVTAAQTLQKALPAGSSVSMGNTSVSMNPPDPLSGFLKRAAMEDKDDNQFRQETQALQTEFKKIGGYDPEQIKALDEIDGLMKSSPDRMTVGQLQASLARLKEKGVLTDQDIARYLPRTLSRDVKGLAGYIGIGNDVTGDMLSPEEMSNVKKYTGEKRASLQALRDRSSQELKARGPMLAPTLTKKGKLTPTLESLGMAASGPSDGGLSPEEKAELDALELKHGKR